MKDLEDVLVRTLQDERRVLPVAAGTPQAVLRAARRLQLRRRLAIGATAFACVAAIAGGTMLADGGSAQDGRAPSYNASVSAQPRTS
jgi:hypothetical protein